MPSTFMGIETAGRALKMNQAVLDVIGHNVSNVDTPGYSRQVAEIRATDPYRSYAPGQSVLAIGTGVEMSGVTRIRDEFVEQRLNAALADEGRYKQLSETLTRVQSAYNDPGNLGLNSALTTFFNAFQDVSRHPESAGPRTLVQHYSADVAKQFRDIYNTLDGAKTDIANQIKGLVEKVNGIAKEIAVLNTEVQKAIALGGPPNDLMDRRDGLVQQLTTLVGGTVVIEQDGTGRKTGAVNVSVGGLPIVQSSTAVPLPSDFGLQRGQPILIRKNDKLPVQSGELSGLIQASGNIQSYIDDLNELASKFITAVNTQHKAGYGLNGTTGLALFSGTDASNIALDSIIANDAESIAAASAPSGGGTPAAGNGENARAIANIASQALFGTMTIQDRYGQAVTRVGADAKGYESQVENEAHVVQQLKNMRSSISGVSMDEELAKMLTYQRSYQAAARLMTTYDNLIEGLIDTIGR